ncbi:MAG: DMT family transporter [Pikeienuella sp.]
MDRFSPQMRAALMMTLCCAFIALSTFFAKVLGRGIGDNEPMSAFQISWGRYLFALLALAPLAMWQRTSFRGAPLPLYAARATCGYGGVTGMFAAAAVMPLADATAISFLNPVFAMFLAIMFLGERVGPVRWVAAAIALSGGALLIRPGFGVIRPEALIALMAAGFMAAEIIFAKLLAQREAVLRLLIITNLIALCIATIAASFVWRAPTLEEWGVMALVGFAMVIAQAFFMNTIRVTDASFATPFFYGTLIFATIYDAAWFSEFPEPLSIAGGLLIVAGAVVLALRDGRRTPALISK